LCNWLESLAHREDQVTVDIKFLAASLGVAPSTVSRALNGYTDISAKTRERIVQRAKELNYQPHIGAQRLVRGRTDAVALVYPLDTDLMGNPKFLTMIESFSDRLEQSGVDLMLAAARENTELITYDRLVRGRRVDGVLLANTRVDDARIDYLKKVNFPFLGYGRCGTRDDFAWYDFDNEAGSRMAVRRLAELGHTRIAHVHSPLDLNFAVQRRAGFLQGMQQAGLSVDPDLIISGRATQRGGMDRRGGYAAAEYLLKMPSPPTAILIDNNLAGVGVIRYILNSGKQLGRDVSVVVDGGIPEDTLLTDIDVACIMQSTSSDSGVTMAEMLLKIIEGEPLEQTHVLVQPQFIEGASIGPVLLS
jgi:LacI family transcriptional regulator